jgi:ABC-type multidrug transport system fused ATPase/permease subunit
VLQLYVLATPFYMQIVVDNAIAKNDHDLLLVLALGFALFLLINTGATLIRARLLTYAQRTLAFQMGTGLFRHLLRLPMSCFGETAAATYRFIGLSGAEIRCRSLQGVEPLRLGRLDRNDRCCAGFRTPAVRRSPHARAAGV